VIRKSSFAGKSARLYLKNKTKSKKDWGYGSVGKALAYQTQDPKFNPDYCKQRKLPTSSLPEPN
jgi:hypothetical protein